MESITYVGLDVHKATISVAVAEGGRSGGSAPGHLRGQVAKVQVTPVLVLGGASSARIAGSMTFGAASCRKPVTSRAAISRRVNRIHYPPAAATRAYAEGQAAPMQTTVRLFRDLLTVQRL